MREMIHVVGRRHALKLRVIAVAGGVPACADPGAFGWSCGHRGGAGLHLAGAFAARWLFFAEAEHVVGLYYGKR